MRHPRARNAARSGTVGDKLSLRKKKMQIYDISQELFSCVVYPGDTPPTKKRVRSIADGDACNVTDLSMCAHNGTHIDAPFHFVNGGGTIDTIPLDRLIGEAWVVTMHGEITPAQIEALPEDCRKLLVRGDGWLTPGSAAALTARGIHLVGTESQSVGPAAAPRDTHLVLLGAQVAVLEGIRLGAVPDGKYTLFAAPINLGGCDGAPVRAVLVCES